MHRLRHLVRSQRILGEFDQLGFVDGLLHHDHGGDRLDPAFVRQADDGDLGDGGMCVQRVFHLARRDEHAAGVDDVLDPVDDEQIALSVLAHQIAGMEPAALERLHRFLGLAPVSGAQLRRAVHDLAEFARREVVHLGVHHACLDEQDRAADGIRPRVVFFGAQHRREWTDLRLAEAVVEPDSRQPLAEFLQYRDGHDRRAVVGLGEAAQIRFGEAGMVRESHPDGRWEEQ